LFAFIVISSEHARPFAGLVRPDGVPQLMQVFGRGERGALSAGTLHLGKVFVDGFRTVPNRCPTSAPESNESRALHLASPPD
jgi:hypothetical protein